MRPKPRILQTLDVVRIRWPWLCRMSWREACAGWLLEKVKGCGDGPTHPSRVETVTSERVYVRWVEMVIFEWEIG